MAEVVTSNGAIIDVIMGARGLIGMEYTPVAEKVFRVECTQVVEVLVHRVEYTTTAVVSLAEYIMVEEILALLDLADTVGISDGLIGV
jgi:hypothetical protein